jgi:alanine racemase
MENMINILSHPKKLFVYSVDEGVVLRKIAPTAEIFVLASLMSQDADIFTKYNLIPVINSMQELKQCSVKDIVLQFNTGMNRSGIEINEIQDIKDYTDKNNNVLMVMSHFCCADEKDNPVNQIVIKNFEKVVKVFDSPNVIKCFQASDAMRNFDLKYMCNAGRLGYLLHYLENNFAYEITAKIKNSVIDIGLNDGITSLWAEKGYFLVDGKKVKIKKITDTQTFLEDTTGTEAILLNQQIYPDFCKFCNSDGLEEIPRLLAKKINVNIEGQKIIHTKDALYSQIMETREIAEDGIVGYCATRQVKKGDRLAVFAGGYLDGIYKKLSNSGQVAWVENTNGEFVPCEYYGRISMDQSIVKIDKHDIKVGAKVIIYDKEHQVSLPNISQEEMFFMVDKSERVRHV